MAEPIKAGNLRGVLAALQAEVCNASGNENDIQHGTDRLYLVTESTLQTLVQTAGGRWEDVRYDFFQDHQQQDVLVVTNVQEE